MNLSAPFIRRPVMTTYVMLALLVVGYICFLRLPVSDLPNIDKPMVNVVASYSGATPETMVKLVTMPLEKELINVRGVKKITSLSSSGSTNITMNFEIDKNMDEAIREIEAALNKAEGSLPKELDKRPTYTRQEASHEHIMFLTMTSASMSTSEMREYVETYIQPRLTRLDGVAEVETFGSPFSVRISINPESMASRHIAFDEVLSAIRQQHSDVPLGKIKTGTRDLVIDLPANFEDVKTFENIVIAKGPVRLKDIGTVTFGPESDVEFHYGNRDMKNMALIIGIKKQSGANTVAISKAVRKAVAEIKTELPPSIDFKIWFDKASWIQESIWDVEGSLWLALILVVLVIFLSLGRFSEALIPATALPLSLIGTCIVMYLLDYSLDLMSLLAMTLAVGFVVDDAIVVLENIVRYNEKGVPPMEASLIGSKQICFTVLSMTLSLVCVFIPLLFMKDVDALLFREFSMTLAIAILISGFISLSLTPMLCSRFLSHREEETKFQAAVHRINASLVKRYKTTLQWSLDRPKTVLSIAALCLALIFPLFTSLPVDLFPKEDRGYIYSFVEVSKGISQKQSDEYQNKIESLIQANPYIDSFLDLSWKETFIFFMKLVPKDQRPSQEEVIAEFNKSVNAIPGTQSFTNAYQLINVNLGSGHGGDFSFVIRGMEMDEVQEQAERLKAVLQKHPEFAFVDTNIKNDKPKLVVNVNDEQARKLGFTKNQIQSVIQKAYGGGNIGKVNKGNHRYNINLGLVSNYKQLPALGKLHLKASDGTPIPIKAVASWEETLGSPSLYRLDQLPAITLNFSLNKGIPINQGLETLQDVATQVLPASVFGKFQGVAEMISETMRDTAFLILASILVMYVVLGILYESFMHPLTILSSLPIAGLGGVLTLMLFNEPLTIYSIVGFLLLIGIVKKNGIMMVDYALEASKDRTKTIQQAIFEGCLIRFRPIMMTTFAAIMGALPIAIGFGDGAEARRGLGLVIVGGLVFSQLLTLYVTPVVFLCLESLKKRKLEFATP